VILIAAHRFRRHALGSPRRRSRPPTPSARRSPARERHSLGDALKDRRVLTFAPLYFTMVVNVYGLSFWVGEIVDKINGLSDVGEGFVTSIPYAVAIVGMALIPRHSDRTGERKLHVAGCLLIAAAAFAISTLVSPAAAVGALAVGLFFLLGAHGGFWTMPAALLSGAARFRRAPAREAELVR
jgi:ACS family tartrate transporter-like MFS transporter